MQKIHVTFDQNGYQHYSLGNHTSVRSTGGNPGPYARSGSLYAASVTVHLPFSATVKSISFNARDEDCGIGTGTSVSVHARLIRQGTDTTYSNLGSTADGWKHFSVSDIVSNNDGVMSVRFWTDNASQTCFGIDNCIIEYVPDGVATDPCPDDGNDCETNRCQSDSAESGDPISLLNGEKRERVTDLTVLSPQQSLDFSRIFRQFKQEDQRHMGAGWDHNHNVYLDLVDEASGTIRMHTGDGGSITFTGGPDTFSPHASSAVLTKDGSQYILTGQNKSIRTFASDGKLTEYTWPSGETWAYTYYSTGHPFVGRLHKVEDDHGRGIQLTYTTIPWATTGLETQLWRVGDLDTLNLDDTVNDPVGRFVQFNYIKQHDDGSALTGDAIPLLGSVRDVRGNTWSYEYFGSTAGEHQTDPLHDYLLRVVAPDGTVKKELVYGTVTTRDVIPSVTEKLGKLSSGAFLEEISYTFDPTNDVTTQTSDGKTTTHHFLNGNYVGPEDPDENQGYQYINDDRRPFFQQDANGHITRMEWSSGGNNLTKVTDADGKETSFAYDTQTDLLLHRTDPGGQRTHYIYDDNNRQPTLVLVTGDNRDLTPDDVSIDALGGWSPIGNVTPQLTQTQVDTGDYAYAVNANMGEGIEKSITALTEGHTYLPPVSE